MVPVSDFGHSIDKYHVPEYSVCFCRRGKDCWSREFFVVGSDHAGPEVGSYFPPLRPLLSWILLRRVDHRFDRERLGGVIRSEYDMLVVVYNVGFHLVLWEIPPGFRDMRGVTGTIATLVVELSWNIQPNKSGEETELLDILLEPVGLETDGMEWIEPEIPIRKWWCRTFQWPVP